MNERLALGTVQFGLDYGVANAAGRVRLEEVKSILREAAAHGVDTLDTAIAYGESEQVLGQAGLAGWNVITKLPALPDACGDVAAWVGAQIQGSLDRLGVNQLHGLLLHRPDQLLGLRGPALREALQDLKARGLARGIGVSIYGPDELDRLAGALHFDLVQAPLNLLDRRLQTSGWARRLREQGTELHVRSAFLQGLLLMAPDHRPSKFARWSGVWAEWSRWLDETGLTPLQACLGYVMGVDGVDKVVVGVDSLRHLQQILAASDARLPSLPCWPQALDADLINPARWSQL